MSAMSAITPIKAAEIMEAVIARGDLADLSPGERGKFYVHVCQTIGLNPSTRPFEYIMLNGKLTLYARKDATDQLRAINGVSVIEMTTTHLGDIFSVCVKVKDARGRSDVATGVVFTAGLKGEALANALMKAETKAKRRATLSLCGLGFLDETEIEAVPAATKAPARDSRPPAPPTAKDIAEARDQADVAMVEAGRDDGSQVIWNDPHHDGIPDFLKRTLPDAPVRSEVEQYEDAEQLCGM